LFIGKFLNRFANAVIFGEFAEYSKKGFQLKFIKGGIKSFFHELLCQSGQNQSSLCIPLW